MIIQINQSISPEERKEINKVVKELGYKTTPVKTQVGEYLIGIGKREFDIRVVGSLPGISDIHRVSDDYKLVSRKFKTSMIRSTSTFPRL